MNSLTTASIIAITYQSRTTYPIFTMLSKIMADSNSTKLLMEVKARLSSSTNNNLISHKDTIAVKNNIIMRENDRARKFSFCL